MIVGRQRSSQADPITCGSDPHVNQVARSTVVRVRLICYVDDVFGYKISASPERIMRSIQEKFK